MTLDFTDVSAARVRLADGLVSRLKERKLVDDARVRMAVSRLTSHEMAAIRLAAEHGPGRAWRWTDQGGLVYTLHVAAVSRLLDKQIIRVAGQFEDGAVAYELAQLGRVVAGQVGLGLRKFRADAEPDSAAVDGAGEAGRDGGEATHPPEPEPSDADGPASAP
jgi:hypothetical protein